MDKKWEKGDTGWIIWFFFPDVGDVVQVDIIDGVDDRGYVVVALPGFFGEKFRCLCWGYQVYSTKEEADEENKKLKEAGHYDRDMEF